MSGDEAGIKELYGTLRAQMMSKNLSIVISFAIRSFVFVSTNVVAQAFNAIAGLLITHWLAVDQYALYTVFITTIGALSVLTKGGVHLGFTAIIGRHWPNIERISAAISAAQQSRRLLSCFVLPPTLIWAGFMFMRGGAELNIAILLSFLLILFWAADMRTRVIDQVLFFANQANRVQILDAALGVARLSFITALFYLNALNAMSASAIGALVAALRILPIGFWIRSVAPTEASAIKEDVKEIRAVIIRQIPAELFYIFQSQIVLSALIVFGEPASLAGFGALARIPQLLVPAQSYFYAFCIPMFAKNKSNVISQYFLFVALCSFPGFALTLLASIFPSWLLFLVGPNYGNLSHEVLICAITAAIVHSAGVAWNLAAHRGWNRWAWIQIPVGLVWCGFGPTILNLGSIEGALWFQCGFSIGLMIATCLDLYAAYRRGDL